ncbi:MAG: alpha/beta fold hydrolase [Candidatus Izemoplasmataceae bacterium]
MATFLYNDKEIYYQLDGNTHLPKMVILNGIMMSTKSWEPFMTSLTESFQVLRFDMFDQGQSSKMDEPYTQAIQVELLNALLIHLKIEKIHVVGISYGGSVALQFAAKYQEKIDKLIVLNAVAKTSDWLKDIGRGWNEVAKTKNGLAYYYITIPFIYSPPFYQKNIAWMQARQKVLVPLFSNDDFLKSMIRLTISAESHDVLSELKAIDIETLIVSSDLDYLTPPHEQIYLKNNLKNATLVTFNGCGHASMYEQPKLFVSTIKGFLLDQKSYKI